MLRVSHALPASFDYYFVDFYRVIKMNLPELDIKKALAGAPIVMIWGAFHTSKGWLHKSKSQEDTFIFESENGMMTFYERSDLMEKARMWEKLVTFKNWHLLNSEITKIEKAGGGTWYLWTGGYIFGKTIWEDALIEGFFPDCEVGTTLYRPGADNE